MFRLRGQQWVIHFLKIKRTQISNQYKNVSNSEKKVLKIDLDAFLDSEFPLTRYFQAKAAVVLKRIKVQ